MLKKIGMVWNPKDVEWETKYKLASEYYAKNQNLLIPITHNVDEINLGMWLKNQRKHFQSGRMLLKRINRLEEIGMVWNEKEDNWDNMYELAKKYYQENLNLLIPREYETNDGIKLGDWIGTQRRMYNNKKHIITPKRITKLEEIGMIWSVKVAQWEEMYKLAAEYYEQNENLLIPAKYEINGVKLGSWIAEQRKSYKKAEIEIDDNGKRIENSKNKDILIKAQKLEKIGMIWDAKVAQWEEMYKIAELYYQKNGDLLVPKEFKTDEDINLGTWIQNQRKKYRLKNENKNISEEDEGLLTLEQIAKLKSIGMIWNTKSKESINNSDEKSLNDLESETQNLIEKEKAVKDLLIQYEQQIGINIHEGKE